MNTKDFIKALRAVIREEVRSAVRQEVGALLTESKQRSQKPLNRQVVQPKPQSKIITGNRILDEVLSETRLTSEFRQSPDVSYQEMNFTTRDVPVSQPSMMNMDVSDESYDDLPQASPALPFMKDYSQLLKKADQIASQKQF